MVCLDISDLYLFHSIVYLNPIFNCFNKLLSYSVDKVTTGTYNFTSVILNVAFVGTFIAGLAELSTCAGTAACVFISVKTQFSDHVKIRFISQLINVMSKVLQKNFKCFNGTTISTLFFYYHFHHYHHHYLVFFLQYYFCI